VRAANPSQALATVLVDELARAGVSDACLAPGSRSAPLAMALHADPRIHLHVRIDERSAAFLALGIARATRRPVAVVCTSGTAAANFHPAVLEAHHARVPLLVLTADRPPELRDTAANQTIDQLRLYGTAVRWCVDVGVPEPRAESIAYWRAVAARAVAVAGDSPPGPVHLNLAFREPLVPMAQGEGFPHELDGRPGGQPWTRVARAPRPAQESELDALAAAVAENERGLLVAADWDGDPEPLLGLARVAGWPVLPEPLSGARTGEQAISTYGSLLADPEFAAAHRPTFVLRVGRQGLSRPLSRLLAGPVPQVLVDADGAWLDPERSLTRVVAADPALVAGTLVKALPPRGTSPWLASWRAAEHRARAALDALLDAEPEPSEPRTARDLAALAPQGSTLVAASSMPVRDLDSFMVPRQGLRVVANRGASGIDGFVSTAVGVALGTGQPTLALAGDLSLLHDVNGLLLEHDRPDLVLVVVNNDGGGIFSFLPQAAFQDGFERLFGTPHGMDLRHLAAAYGCGYRRLERADELEAIVAEAQTAGGVQIVEVRTDRAANLDLHRRLLAAVAESIAVGAS
jgi:2-succinyl-5-enolpyruvyl-6-hydroxy-3-cyclohexene-1-carboxylate synthase